MKRRIHTNVWGNTYGYEGTRRVKAFDLNTSQAEFDEWLKETEDKSVAKAKQKPEHNPAPVVQLFKLGQTEPSTKIFALLPKQTMDTNRSTNYNDVFVGPALIHQDIGPNGRFTTEMDVNDSHEWQWIQKLMQVGYNVLNAQAALLRQIDGRELKPEHKDDIQKLYDYLLELHKADQ